jgi:SAM-dependent methyltransferase
VSSTDDVWRRALPGEVGFWADYVRTGGLDAPQDFQARLNPDAPILDPYLLSAIDRASGNPVRIIDVGAGPMTSIGFKDHRSPQRGIEVTAVDPLANDYATLLAAAGITPPVVTQRCRGEDVADTFGVGQFDIAYARNSLDHSVAPMDAIESMLEATKPDGSVVLVHGLREGEARGYEELHQWNFDIRNDRLVLHGRRQFYDVADQLTASVEIATDTFSAGEFGEWIVATITRTQ